MSRLTPQKPVHRRILSSANPSFLVSESHVDIGLQNIELATLCIDYLNLPSFTCSPSNETVLNGDYGFMEYALVYWLRHFETALAFCEHLEEQTVLLAESLDRLLEHHWMSPKFNFPISQKVKESLHCFEELPFYNKLEQTVASTRKQLTFFGEMKEEEIALDFLKGLAAIRASIEKVTSIDDDIVKEDLEHKYGNKVFKCSRFSCHYFASGFSTAAERDKHVGKHVRPYRCREEHCTGFIWGFTAAKDLEKHMQTVHSSLADEIKEFPTDREVEMSNSGFTPVEAAAFLDNIAKQDSEINRAHLGLNDELTPDLSQSLGSLKSTEMTCSYCGKAFTKKYNLTSHLNTHTDIRPFACQICDAKFARKSDYERHSRSHSAKNFNCAACGKKFSRADMVTMHHKSQRGQRCLKRLM